MSAVIGRREVERMARSQLGPIVTWTDRKTGTCYIGRKSGLVLGFATTWWTALRRAIKRAKYIQEPSP